MTLNDSAWKGAFIPFPTPVPVETPPALPGDSPLRCLKFNKYYEPLVRGAVKALARPETYRGLVADVQDHVYAGRELQTLFADFSGGTTEEWSWEVTDGSWQYHQYYPLADANIFGNMGMTSGIKLEGRNAGSFDVLSGGSVTLLDIYAGAIPTAIFVEITQCNNVVVSASSFNTWSLAAQLSVTSIAAKIIEITLAGTCMVNIHRQGAMLCTEA